MRPLSASHADLSRPACWGRGVVPTRAPVLVPSTRHRPVPGRLTRGFALATENPDARRIGSAGEGGRQEALLESLLQQVASLTEETRNANRIQIHRIMVEQTGRALDDPTLAEAMSTLQGLSEAKRRQMLFINAQYSFVMLNHQLDYIDWDGLIGHLRVWCVNDVFQEYWELTRDHRKSLPRESLEATVGRAVDSMLEELAEGAEEWWVVGPSE